MSAGSAATSPDDKQRNIWNEVEQEDAYLVDRHPCVMESVELLSGQPKPSSVKPINRIVSEAEEQKP